MGGLHDKLLKIKVYDQFIEWTKSVILPGFGNLPLYTVATFFFEEIARESILNKASSLAYNFMLAIFPGIIFLFTLIPYIPVDNFQNQLMELIEVTLPVSAYEFLETTLNDIVRRQNSGLLSVGFVLCTFFASNGMITLMVTFNKSALAKEERTWGQKRITALALSFSVVIALAIGIFLYAGTNFLINYLKNHIQYDLTWLWTFAIKSVQWIFMFGIYFFTVSIVYKFGPSKSRNFRFFTPGGTLATILAVLTFSGFGYYINNFGAYNKLYGSIGTIIVMMIWMYLNALIIIIGFELNASIALSKKNLKIVRPKTHNVFKTSHPFAKGDNKPEH